MFSKRSLTGLACLLSVISALPTISILPRGASEAVVLANCYSNGQVVASQMAYYSSGAPAVSGPPLTVSVVKYGTYQVWEGAPVTGNFPDGDYFTADIPSPVSKSGDYAGTGQNKKDSFYCYQNVGAVTYESLGTSCSSVYICDHTPAGVRVDISTNANYVELTGLGKVNAYDVFWHVWDKRGIHSCDTTPVPLGGGCSITFICEGGDDWTTTNGMASTLVGVVGHQDGIENTWTTISNPCVQYCSTPAGSYCCNAPDVTTWHTSIAQTMTISVTDLTTHDARGSLTYALTCATPAPDCSFFDKLTTGITAAVGVLAPEVAPYFAVGSAIISATAHNSGGCA